MSDGQQITGRLRQRIQKRHGTPYESRHGHDGSEWGYDAELDDRAVRLIEQLTAERDEYKSRCEGMFEVGGFEYFNQQLTAERDESSRLRNAIELMKKERFVLGAERDAALAEVEQFQEAIREALSMSGDEYTGNPRKDINTIVSSQIKLLKEQP